VVAGRSSSLKMLTEESNFGLSPNHIPIKVLNTAFENDISLFLRSCRSINFQSIKNLIIVLNFVCFIPSCGPEAQY